MIVGLIVFEVLATFIAQFAIILVLFAVIGLCFVLDYVIKFLFAFITKYSSLILKKTGLKDKNNPNLD